MSATSESHGNAESRSSVNARYRTTRQSPVNGYYRLWWALDYIAHTLHTPTLRRGVRRTRWHHRLHLIPGRWMKPICDRYDRELGWQR